MTKRRHNRRSIPPKSPPLGVLSLARTERGWYLVPHTWLTLGALTSATVTLTGAGVWFYARHIEPRWIDWHSITLPIPNLPAAFEGYRIVHLSDLHLGAAKELTPARLMRILRRVNHYRPDMVAITGDFVATNDAVSQDGITRLAALRARDGIFCIPGNHEYWAGIEAVRSSVAAAGGQWLINAHHVIRRGSARLTIAGIDDPWEGKPDLHAALAGAPHDVPAILLAHPPNVADAAIQEPSIVLQLSGHSHGGQVRIPGIGPLTLPDQSGHYPSGLYHVEADDHALWVYTNRGLGLAEVPFRFACRPEVTIITLTR